jgi:hypothetical protein
MLGRKGSPAFEEFGLLVFIVGEAAELVNVAMQRVGRVKLQIHHVPVR